MMIRKLSLAFVVIAAVAPVVASASPEEAAALNACAKAFASSLAAPGAGAPTFKLNYAQQSANPVSDFYSRQYTFTLKAANPKTGIALASATCSANTQGQVLALNASSVPTDATLASR